MHTLLLVSLLAAPPALPEVVDADAMAWVHVPRAGASLAALERSGFAALAGALLPADVRKSLAGSPDAELIAASFRSATPGQAEVALWLDAGTALAASVAMMERWLGQLGFAAGEPTTKDGVTLHTLNRAGGSMTVFSGQGRCGWSSDAERAARVLAAAEPSLAGDAAFAALVARSPDADVRGRLDVQKFYGMLARSPRGPQLAGRIRRLGLERLEAIEVRAELDKDRLEAEAKLILPEPWTDLPAALGPAIAHERPAMVPKRASGFARVSVKPAELWYVAEKLYGYQRAMESSLVRAQLDGIERQLGRSFTEDALGHEPRAWTTWATNEGRVLVAEVADAELAARLLSAYAEVLPTFFPDLSVKKQTAGKRELLVLELRGRPLVTLGFADGAIVVAASREQVERALAARGKRKRSLGKTPVVAHGEGSALLAPLLSRLPSHLRAPLASQSASWQLRAINDGFLIEAVARAK